MINDRFKFEQEFMECWSVVEDIGVILNRYDRKPLTEDELLNCLIGLQQLYSMKFERAFNTFETLIKDKHL